MKKYAFLSLLAVLALGACDDDDDPTGNDNVAFVRVVNATTTTTGTANTYTAVNLYRGNTEIIAGVAAGSATTCTQFEEIPAGNQTLHFRTAAAAAQVGSVQHNFVAGKRYTIVLMGHNNTTGLQAKVFEDENLTVPPTGQRRIRFINASTTAGNGDIFTLATATTAPTGTPAVQALAGGSFAYVNTANANTGFRFFDAGSTTAERFSYTLDTDPALPSNNATVLFTTNGAIQFNACN